MDRRHNAKKNSNNRQHSSNQRRHNQQGFSKSQQIANSFQRRDHGGDHRGQNRRQNESFRGGRRLGQKHAGNHHRAQPPRQDYYKKQEEEEEDRHPDDEVMQQPSVWKKARLMHENENAQPRDSPQNVASSHDEGASSEESFMEPKSSPEQQAGDAGPSPARNRNAKHGSPREEDENEVDAEEEEDVYGNGDQHRQCNFDPLSDFVSFDEIDKPPETSPQSALEEKLNRKVHYPWLTDYTSKLKDVNCFLHNEIIDFVQWVQEDEATKEQRRQLVRRIKKVVKQSYPDAVVMVFGSCATGLNLPNSDIDLLVYNPSVSEISMINKLQNQLLRAGICKSIEPLKHTKVPIIKLTDKDSNINVDISFNRTNGIYCVKLVKFLLKKYPELKPLILVVKAFLKSRNLNETYHGGVSSFLLTMLTTSYLQRQYRAGGTDKMELGRHLINFFELYGKVFNYEYCGISVRKEGSYFLKEKKGWAGFDEKTRGRLCVENPQDPDIDIGKAAYNIKKVQRAFQHAYDTLVFNNQDSVSLLKLIITEDPATLKTSKA